MRHYLIRTVLGIAWASTAFGQTTQTAPPAGGSPAPSGPATAPTQAAPPAAPPVAPKGADKAPSGEPKLRAVCKQLNLTDDQWKQAETLIQVFNAELDELRRDPKKIIEEIEAKYGELKDAKNSGDESRVKKLKEELRGLAPTSRAERHFFDGLVSVLNAEQKVKLEKIRRAESGAALKPFQVVRIARQVELTPQQDRDLERVMREYRTKVAGSPNAAVDEFIAEVRLLLTNTQQSKFDQLIDEARFGDDDGSTPKPPAPAPAPAPAKPDEKK